MSWSKYQQVNLCWFLVIPQTYQAYVISKKPLVGWLYYVVLPKISLAVKNLNCTQSMELLQKWRLFLRISPEIAQQWLPWDETWPMTDPNGAAIYGVPWIPSIYPLYVSINIPAPWILYGWFLTRFRGSDFYVEPRNGHRLDPLRNLRLVRWLNGRTLGGTPCGLWVMNR